MQERKTYIATFYSHFGAIRFRRLCIAQGWTATIMPVPRDLSSSCGTCVKYESERFCPDASIPEEVEQIVQAAEGGYLRCYRAENS